MGILDKQAEFSCIKQAACLSRMGAIVEIRADIGARRPHLDHLDWLPPILKTGLLPS
jgi:hypothetical protein